MTTHPQAPRDPVAQRRLWELAQDASAYLRKHASPAVRLATALLLAASLAACNASASDTNPVQQLETQTVAPLTQEVASGLPRGPGSYEVVTGSVFRDQRGVYQFEWLDAGTTAGPGHVAHVSRLRLVRGEKLTLEMTESASASSAQGDDPVLHLPENEDVNLIQQAQVGAVQPGPQYYPPVYSHWNPFLVGMLLGGSRPGYYDPPRTIVVQQPAGTLGSGSGTTGTIPRVSGGSASDTARAPAQRVTGVQSAVSGRAGGTGTGSAVTNRNPASAASSSARAGSGVSAPRSGGFSSGVGSSGGSSAS